MCVYTCISVLLRVVGARIEQREKREPERRREKIERGKKWRNLIRASAAAAAAAAAAAVRLICLLLLLLLPATTAVAGNIITKRGNFVWKLKQKINSTRSRSCWVSYAHTFILRT